MFIKRPEANLYACNFDGSLTRIISYLIPHIGAQNSVMNQLGLTPEVSCPYRSANNVPKTELTCEVSV